MFREKKNFSDELFLHFSSKVQNLTVFSIIYMIRIRFFGPGELIQKYFSAAQYCWRSLPAASRAELEVQRCGAAGVASGQAGRRAGVRAAPLSGEGPQACSAVQGWRLFGDAELDDMERMCAMLTPKPDDLG